MLVEALIVVGIVGFALAGMLGALSTGALGLKSLTSRNTAASLAGAQMEYIRAQPFTAPPTSYSSGVTAPSGFSVASEGQTVPGTDANIQRVIVTVMRNGQTITTLESLKVNHP